MPILIDTIIWGITSNTCYYVPFASLCTGGVEFVFAVIALGIAVSIKLKRV